MRHCGLAPKMFLVKKMCIDLKLYSYIEWWISKEQHDWRGRGRDGRGAGGDCRRGFKIRTYSVHHKEQVRGGSIFDLLNATLYIFPRQRRDLRSEKG